MNERFKDLVALAFVAACIIFLATVTVKVMLT